MTQSSDKSSYSCFVRRTFSAPYDWNSSSSDKFELENHRSTSTLSSVIMTLVLLYEPLPDMDESSLTRMKFYKRYLIWLKYHVKEIVRSPVGYSHCNDIKFIRSTLAYK
ncbi:hypothetical protein QL285_039721 [Trifolium repens]|nr:hypothetical protein QL285_039721 [Trifolium repens]